VCDEDADGFIRVEHFVALGLQFGQGDEVSGATPGPCAWPGPLPRPLAAAQLSPAAPAVRERGHGSAWPDRASTVRTSPSPTLPHRRPESPRPSGRPRLRPSGRPRPAPLGAAPTPPVPQGVPEPPSCRFGAPFPQGRPVALPLARRVLPKDSPDPPFPQGVPEPSPSLSAARTPRADLAPGTLGWRDRSLSGPLPEAAGSGVRGGRSAFRGEVVIVVTNTGFLRPGPGARLRGVSGAKPRAEGPGAGRRPELPPVRGRGCPQQQCRDSRGGSSPCAPSTSR